MALPFAGIHTGSELSRTSHFASYSAGGFDAKVKFDSSGNRYVCYLSGIFIKFNSKNELVWQKSISNLSVQGFTLDSSGNIYICGTYSNNPNGVGVVVKLNSSLAVLWQKQYPLTQWVSNGGQIYVDSSGNVYCGFWYGPSNNDYADLAKYNSSGVLQWRLQITHPSSGYNCRPGDITTDSSGNVYMGAHTYNSSLGWDSYAIKVNSSGGVQWQKKITNSTTDLFISTNSFTDSSGNVYFFGFSGYRTVFFTKLDTNGNMLWQKEIQKVSGDFLVQGTCAFDGTNFYFSVWGTKNGIDTYNKGYIFCVDTAGNLVSQRGIDIDSSSIYTYGLDVTSTHVAISGYGPFKWLFKALKNGKKTGTYKGIGHTLIYYTSSLSWVNSSASITSGSISISGISTSTSDFSLSMSDTSGTYAIRTF
jgi:hypothetical protein